MVIITVVFLFLFELRFKIYGRPYVIVPEFFNSRKVYFYFFYIYFYFFIFIFYFYNPKHFIIIACNIGWLGTELIMGG